MDSIESLWRIEINNSVMATMADNSYHLELENECISLISINSCFSRILFQFVTNFFQ